MMDMAQNETDYKHDLDFQEWHHKILMLKTLNLECMVIACYCLDLEVLFISIGGPANMIYSVQTATHKFEKWVV